MISLIILYYVGKAFSDLANKYERSNWLYAILGIGSYFIVQLVFGFALAVVWYSTNDTEWDPGAGLDLIGIVIGALSCWGFYTWLDYYWSKNPNVLGFSTNESDLLDDDLILE